VQAKGLVAGPVGPGAVIMLKTVGNTAVRGNGALAGQERLLGCPLRFQG